MVGHFCASYVLTTRLYLTLIYLLCRCQKLTGFICRFRRDQCNRFLLFPSRIIFRRLIICTDRTNARIRFRIWHGFLHLFQCGLNHSNLEFAFIYKGFCWLNWDKRSYSRVAVNQSKRSALYSSIHSGNRIGNSCSTLMIGRLTETV